MIVHFLTKTELAVPITLEPKEDTLYILPADLVDATLTLTLSLTGVRAFLVGLFTTTAEQSVVIHQNHTAKKTESHILLKTLVGMHGNFQYHGNIHIEKSASGCNASQEVRGLLVSEEARFKAIPSLEILPKDVTCTHKASSSPVNKDSLYILKTKGFSEAEARVILEQAFLKGAFDVLKNWPIADTILTELELKLLEAK